MAEPIAPNLAGFPGTSGRLSSLGALADGPSRLWPDAVAVDDGRRRLTFRELVARADALACCLRGAGVSPGDRVMVLADKCLETVVVAIGIWKAGAIYAPVDIANPLARMEWLHRNLEPGAVAGPQRLLREHAACWGGATLLPFESIASLDAVPADDVARLPEVGPSDPAYILHTSGSTGTPKGVLMEHGAVVQYFAAHNEVFRFDHESRAMNNAPFHFDVSIQDTFLPLAFGARVFLPSGFTTGSTLLHIVARERITHVIAVATVLALMTGDGSRLATLDVSAVRVVMTGAEVCDVKVLNAWLTRIPGVRVVNGYGPTEVNSISLTHVIDAPDLGRTTFFPIGKPLRGVNARLVDDDGQIVSAEGVQGELVLGGGQLMRAYWRSPEETHRRFISIDGERFYRTGDLCWRDAMGDYHFVGRADSEVKIAGRRINLVEVESAITRHPGIQAAFAGVVDVGERRQLAAVVTAIDGSPHALRLDERLADFVATLLPPYMVPALWGITARTLLGASGKSDRRRMLRDLGAAASVHGRDLYVLGEDEAFRPADANHAPLHDAAGVTP